MKIIQKKRRKPKPKPNLLSSSSMQQASTADVHAPAAATAAVVLYTAVAGRAHAISGIAWSYSATPTGGNLKIEDADATIVFTMDISAAGAGVIAFPMAKLGKVGNLMRVTLASGAGSVVGKVSVLNHWTQ